MSDECFNTNLDSLKKSFEADDKQHIRKQNRDSLLNKLLVLISYTKKDLDVAYILLFTPTSYHTSSIIIMH